MFPRFQPSDRFCELSFRYLSPGIEGEKCRSLDHFHRLNQIHDFYQLLYIIHRTVVICCIWYIQVCLSTVHICNCAWALEQTFSLRFSAVSQVMSYSIPLRAGEFAQIDGIYACAFSEQTKHSVVPLNLTYFHLFISKLQATGI